MRLPYGHHSRAAQRLDHVKDLDDEPVVAVQCRVAPRQISHRDQTYLIIWEPHRTNPVIDLLCASDPIVLYPPGAHCAGVYDFSRSLAARRRGKEQSGGLGYVYVELFDLIDLSFNSLTGLRRKFVKFCLHFLRHSSKSEVTSLGLVIANWNMVYKRLYGVHMSSTTPVVVANWTLKNSIR